MPGVRIRFYVVYVICTLIISLYGTSSAQRSAQDAGPHKADITSFNFSTAKTITQSAGLYDWDDRFYIRGSSGEVDAFAVNGEDIYVGGCFEFINNILNKYCDWAQLIKNHQSIDVVV